MMMSRTEKPQSREFVAVHAVPSMSAGEACIVAWL